MANVINNHGSGNSNSNTISSTNNSVSSVGTYNNLPGSNNAGDVQQFHNLRDVCNMLSSAAITPTGEKAYDYIIDMMRGLNLQDDGILMNHKIKSIETEFCNIVRDEAMLCESMNYINEKALDDGETALKFAMLFSSRNFDALAMKEIKVRSAMLKLLETNFINADVYRVHDKNRLYNSITLLGEYYHRVRLANNSPIAILGESLLTLLIRALSEGGDIDARLAKLVLTQITLNGDIMRTYHKGDLTQLLFHIRRNLIEQPALEPAVKALLLMTLDLYYSNFTNLGAQLEEMYTKYLIQGEEDEDNNNFQAQFESQAVSQHPQPQAQLLPQSQPQPQQLQQATNIPNYTNSATSSSQTQPPQLQQQLSNTHAGFENGQASSSANDSFEIKPSTKKWSEQVCEDSIFDADFQDPYNYDEDVANKSGESGVITSVEESKTKSDGNERNSRRAFQPRRSPRPLKKHYNNKDSDDGTIQGDGEDRDETKPLPRWRAPRFNSRDNKDHYNGRGRNDQNQRRYSASYDDDIDHQSVRSEGGNGSSLRLYSINDRMKHSHERFERTTGGPSSGQFNNIVNSNWDRQSQRDDRSERSYISNYERGNYKRGSNRYNNNNRNTYDKPPRFQKNHHQYKHSNGNLEQQKIHSDSWRRSNTSVNNVQFDDNCAYEQDSQNRSSPRARTLPRPAKSSIEGGGGNNRQGNNYRHNANHAGGGDGGPQKQQQYQQQQRYTRNYNARYSSQSSLTSETSSTLDRRNQQNPHYHQRHRNFSRRTRPENQNDDRANFRNNGPDQQEERQSSSPSKLNESWNAKDDSEVVRNAAEQTAKYINYLSSQK